jgi:hypothetical protein
MTPGLALADESLLLYSLAFSDLTRGPGTTRRDRHMQFRTHPFNTDAELRRLPAGDGDDDVNNEEIDEIEEEDEDDEDEDDDLDEDFDDDFDEDDDDLDDLDDDDEDDLEDDAEDEEEEAE